MAAGFFKFNRGDAALELVRRPNELALFSLVAHRAKRTNSFSIHDLAVGEALIGDHQSCGLTRQQYRTALKNLKKWGFLTTRATNKGTIAKIINSDVFDINIEDDNHPPNHQATTGQPSGNHRATTNKNEKKDKNGKKVKEYSSDSDEIRLSETLRDQIVKNNPGSKARAANMQKWAVNIDRMIRIDKRTPDQIRSVIIWCQNDPFWHANILSTEKLRSHFDRLYLHQQCPPSENKRHTKGIHEKIKEEGREWLNRTGTDL